MMTSTEYRTALTEGRLRVEQAPRRLTEDDVQQIRDDAQEELGLREDLHIAYLVRERDADDTGERIAVDDLVREFGFDPSTLAE